MNRIAEKHNVAAVAMLPTLSPGAVLGVRNFHNRHLLIQGVDRRNLRDRMRAIAARPLFEFVAHRIRTSLPHPILASVLARVVLQVPPPASSKARDMEEEGVEYVRKVKQMADMAGCSRSYLHKVARDISPSLQEIVQEIAALHGISIYNGTNSSDVAARLGYESPHGWWTLARRRLGGLRTAGRLPLGQHAERLLELLGV